MKVVHPKLLVRSTLAVVPAIRQPTGLPPSRVPVRAQGMALAPEANRQA